jgi:Fe-S cluster biogenesis protein NfuA
MKMGIERILHENFRNIKEILAVDPNEAATLTVDKVSQSLEKLLPAIKGLGGSIEVTQVDANTGAVYIKFVGPARLQKGVELVLKDNESIKQVVFV